MSASPQNTLRTGVLAFALVSYAIFLGTFVYALGFIGNFLVPKSIDSAASGSLWSALAVNVALLGIFAIQHSVMARPAFKRWFTRVIPQAAERSTYVLLSSAALLLLFWQWRPLGGQIWQVEGTLSTALLYGGFAAGWLLVLVTTFLINHFDLFGLRQAWLFFRGRPCLPLRFVTPGPYRMVRHPLYLGWLLAFWCTPSMTAAHLLFAVGTTAYILIAVRFEERDLLNEHGEDYRRYRDETPMIVPRLGSVFTQPEREAGGSRVM